MDYPLKNLYSPGQQKEQENCLRNLTRQLEKYTGSREPATWFSAPGRVEIAGNHTDHNHGRVLAAAIQMDTVAAARRTDDGTVTISSQGFGFFTIGCGDLRSRPAETGTCPALIRGILDYFQQKGYRIGGFQAIISSRVTPGSGLSSSASFEAVITGILNHFYNRNRLSLLEMARAGQYAENSFFGKPCGLMDQIACLTGGALEIDFREPRAPRIMAVPLNPWRYRYSLLTVNTGSGHADLTGEYAAIPAEMIEVARFFGAETLREVSESVFIHRLSRLRDRFSDRHLLRAFHFFTENRRVPAIGRYLKEGRFARALEIISESGLSSVQCLQNIYPSGDLRYQPLSLALALSREFFRKEGHGICRVHGGGFGGTILAILPSTLVGKYRQRMESLFGRQCCQMLTIRKTGIVAGKPPGTGKAGKR
jgi:galactokinase